MRFPDTTIPPQPVGQPAQPVPTLPVPAAPPVGPRRAPLTGQPEAEPGAHERAGGDEAAEGGEVRYGEDRRKMCRRIYHLPVLLDTRSGLDRRGEARRDHDLLSHIDQDI